MIVEGAQNIPSELAYLYDGTLTQKLATGAIRTRYPWRLPKPLGVGIDGSPAQKLVRIAFRQCVDCFNASPETGGVTPPDYGLRSRQWWYNAASGSGLWYYDYFIQQSIPYYLNNYAPVWCSALLTYANQVSEIHPGTNFYNYIYCPISFYYGKHTEAYIKIPDIDFLNVGLKVYNWSTWYGQPTYWRFCVYQVSDAWDPITLTWNNKPPLGNKIAELIVYKSSTWVWFTLPSYTPSIAISWIGGNVIGSGVAGVTFYSSYVTPITNRPYLFV